MNKIIIVGYSGHSFVIIDSLIRLNYNVVGYYDKWEKKNNPYDLKYLGFEDDPETIKSMLRTNLKFFITIGSNNLRAKLFQKMKDLELQSVILVNPDSSISNYALLEEGVFVSSGARINAFSKIGKGCIINTGSIIEHECMISKFSHIAPGAVLAGNVFIGERSFVGANTTIREGVSVGEDSIIGAGSVVLSNIPGNQTWVGNPARRLK